MDPSTRAARTYLRLALLALALAIVFGALGVLHHAPGMSSRLEAAGLSFTQLRPLHETTVHLWIFTACLAMLSTFLGDEGAWASRGVRLRHHFSLACFLLAGVGAIVTLALRITSGREYLGFHPAVSALFLAGWLAFAWTWVGHVRHAFWSRPVYVYQWTIGILFFIYTFLEGHAYLLPSVAAQPLVDLQIQWKSCGTLVGSFNFMVYGSLLWMDEKLSGDPTRAQSPLAFSLFAVGCLNSFTNFAHHTYHLPQSHVVKWIAFVVSMLEIIIVAKILADIVKGLQRPQAAAQPAPALFMTAAKWWTWSMIAFALLLSWPPLNSLLHGTLVVVGHAMGTEIGIDTMILLAALCFLLARQDGGRTGVADTLAGRALRRSALAMNTTAAALVGWLIVVGSARGLARYHGAADPVWLAGSGWVFPILGIAFGLAVVAVLAVLVPIALRRSPA